MGEKKKGEGKAKVSKKPGKAAQSAKPAPADEVEVQVAESPVVAEATHGKPAKSPKSRIRYEGSMAREEAVSYFEAIVSGLKKGTIRFKQGDEALSLVAPDRLEVEVKATRKGDKAKVSFEMAWHGAEAQELEIGS